MNTLKARATIGCTTCGTPLKRTKSIKVAAATQDGAKKEAEGKINDWMESLKGTNCKCCQSIINELASSTQT